MTAPNRSRLLSLTASAMLSISLAGCSSSDGARTDDTATGTGPTSSTAAFDTLERTFDARLSVFAIVIGELSPLALRQE